MKVIKLRKLKAGSIITTKDESLVIPVDIQDKSIESFTKSAPRVIVAGPTQPIPANGLTWSKTGSTVPMRHAIAAFLGNFPGHEVVILAEPGCYINRENVDKLLEFAQNEKVMLTWGAHFPGGFVLTSQCIAHILNDMPVTMTFRDDWKAWVKKWAENMLRHRFFDANTYGISTIPDYPKPEETKVAEEPKKKKVVVRRVKVVNGLGS